MDRERKAALEGRLAELRESWDLLISETEKRKARLAEANRAQQFYADAAEAEAWMGEQELHMMSEEKAKVSYNISKVFWNNQYLYIILNHQNMVRDTKLAEFLRH